MKSLEPEQIAETKSSLNHLNDQDLIGFILIASNILAKRYDEGTCEPNDSVKAAFVFVVIKSAIDLRRIYAAIQPMKGAP